MFSDAKVDMFLPQIPHEAQKKISTEFGFDLKVFKATRKTEEDSEQNRIVRLEAVVAFLREYGNLGSLSTPDSYFEGTEEMAMTTLHDMILFTLLNYNRSVCLAGSGHHMLGYDDSLREKGHLASLTYHIFRQFAALEHGDKRANPEFASSLPESIYRYAKHLDDLIKIPRNRYEFLAKG